MERKENFYSVKHLYNRAGFGISYAPLVDLSKKKLTKVVDELFKNSAKIEPLQTVDSNEVRQQMALQSELGAKKELTPEEKDQRQEITRIQNERSRSLNIDWLMRMMNTTAPLREKMTLFWHGHFACRSNNPMFAQELNNIQRTYALGSFRTLLVEVSKSPAMLQYLNNQQNRKGRPNENFARELMELFTLGIGNYTEQDIRESARAFTGWTYDKDGRFQLRPNFHDEGNKTFFGKTGNFDGESIIDMILEKPQTAQFIASKLYLFFVNETPNKSHITELANHFQASNYDISAVLKKMFTSSWFYAPENVGTKIKSPVEFLVNLSREFAVTYNKPQVLISLQTSLGQYLFNPPNVAGWPGGKTWIDSSSLMLRLKIPSLVLNDGTIDFSGKADPEDEAVIALNKPANAKPKPKTYVDAQSNWPKFLASLPKDTKPLDLASFLLQPPLDQKLTAMLANNQGLKSTAIQVTSLPEYQLC